MKKDAKNNKQIYKIIAIVLIISIIASIAIVYVYQRFNKEKFEERTLINFEDEWQYLIVPKEESFNDASWASTDFEAMNWEVGKSAFGFIRDSDEVSVEDLNYGTFLDGVRSFANPVYFRKVFNIKDINSIKKLFVEVRYDDGFVLYINGQVAFYHNVPNTREISSEYSENDYVQVTDKFYDSIVKKLDATLFNKGENVIGVEVWNNSANNDDLYFDLRLYANPPLKPYTVTDLNFSQGTNETELRFAWYTEENPEDCVVQVAKKQDYVNEIFPEDKAQSFYGKVVNAVSGFSSNKVTVTGIESMTDYVYRVGDGNKENWSEVYEFSTRNPKDYKLIVLGDAQIGGYRFESDTVGWMNTLKASANKVPDASFIVSLGDQVNSGNNEGEYTGFFLPKELRRYPLVTVIGNHDGEDPNHSYHFNYPNASKYGRTPGGSNYYFSYGDTLFIVLNTNSDLKTDHEATVKEAVNSHKDARWKVVLMHHSIYGSCVNHDGSSSVAKLRKILVPIFEENDIDIVFQSHEHAYTRTKLMWGDKPVLNGEFVVHEDGSLSCDEGIVYLTLNSSSGSKYYTLTQDVKDYVANRSQIYAPTFTEVEVNNNIFKVTTYRADIMEVTDSVCLRKN